MFAMERFPHPIKNVSFSSPTDVDLTLNVSNKTETKLSNMARMKKLQEKLTFEEQRLETHLPFKRIDETLAISMKAYDANHQPTPASHFHHSNTRISHCQGCQAQGLSPLDPSKVQALAP